MCLGLRDVLGVATVVDAHLHLVRRGGRRRGGGGRSDRGLVLARLVVATLVDGHARAIRTLGANRRSRLVPRERSDVHARVATVGTNSGRPVDGAIRANRYPPDVACLVADLVEVDHLVTVEAGVAVHAGIRCELHGNHALSPKEGSVKLGRSVVGHDLRARLVGGRGSLAVLGVLGGGVDGLCDKGLTARVATVLRPVDLVAGDDLTLRPAHGGETLGEAVGRLLRVGALGKGDSVGLALECLPQLGVLGLQVLDVLGVRVDDRTDVWHRLALRVQRRSVDLGGIELRREVEAQVVVGLLRHEVEVRHVHVGQLEPPSA